MRRTTQTKPEPAASPQAVSIAEAARRWDVHSSTIRRMIADGRIKVMRFSQTAVRIPIAELERLEREALC